MMMMTMIAVMMNIIGIVIMVKVAIIIYDYDGNVIMLANVSMVIGIMILMDGYEDMRMIELTGKMPL